MDDSLRRAWENRRLRRYMRAVGGLAAWRCKIRNGGSNTRRYRESDNKKRARCSRANGAAMARFRFEAPD